MKEIRAIIAAYTQARHAGLQLALATVVHVEGSSYRKPGARMLVTEEGEFTGAISGGCLEGDALRKALLAIMQRKNKLVTYDTSRDELALGLQLGCNGMVHILFEYVDPTDPYNPVELLIASQDAKRKPTLFTTLFSLDSYAVQPGSLLYAVGSEKPVCHPEWQQQLPEALCLDVQQALASGQSSCQQYRLGEQLYYGFLELIEAPIALILVGAGNDALPVATFAEQLGWEITLVDGRKTHANNKRFPFVSNIIVAGPDEAMEQLVLDERSAVVLMTHNYAFDKAMLGLLQDQPCAYIGSLGPQKKLHKMFADLAAEGTPVSEAAQAKIYGPIGLDIGADTPEEVALSIIAEIKACMQGKTLPSLKFKEGPIHQRYAGKYLLPVSWRADTEEHAADRALPEDFACAVDMPLKTKT